MAGKRYVKGEKIIATNCSAYLLPMLFESYDAIPLFKGCFVGDLEKPELDHNIFILCKFNGNIEQKAFEDNMSDTDLFVTLYYPDDYTTMFVYNILPQLDKDYMLIRQGKFSMISDFFKKKICKFWELNEKSKYYQILYKSEERRLQLEEEFGTKISKDAELGTIFTKESDWFNDKHKEKKLGGFENGRSGD